MIVPMNSFYPTHALANTACIESLLSFLHNTVLFHIYSECAIRRRRAYQIFHRSVSRVQQSENLIVVYPGRMASALVALYTQSAMTNNTQAYCSPSEPSQTIIVLFLPNANSTPLLKGYSFALLMLAIGKARMY